jgi:16S rRNA processing protein RimM
LTSPTDRPDLSGDRVAVGTVGRAHALKGAVVVHPTTDYPARFSTGKRFFTDSGRVLTVASASPFKGGMVVAFVEVTDRNAAEALAGQTLLIEEGDRRSLGSDEYWPDQLIGLTARDPSGGLIGVVESVDDSTAQPRLIVQSSGGSVMVPLVSALVTNIDVEKGLLVIEPIEGLLTPDEPE